MTPSSGSGNSTRRMKRGTAGPVGHALQRRRRFEPTKALFRRRSARLIFLPPDAAEAEFSLCSTSRPTIRSRIHQRAHIALQRYDGTVLSLHDHDVIDEVATRSGISTAQGRRLQGPLEEFVAYAKLAPPKDSCSPDPRCVENPDRREGCQRVADLSTDAIAQNASAIAEEPCRSNRDPCKASAVFSTSPRASRSKSSPALSDLLRVFAQR